jgi:hypothetical protein
MKKSVVSLLLVAVACPALPAEPSFDRLVGCADVKDSRDRLACFDREVAPLAIARSRPAPISAPPPVARNSLSPAVPIAAPTPPASAPLPVPKTSFGEEQLQPKDRTSTPADEQALHARIERIRAVSGSDFIVYLDNGQAWQHQDAVLGGYLRVGEPITITKGTLGSYRLTRDAGQSKNWIRVTRIR